MAFDHPFPHGPGVGWALPWAEPARGAGAAGEKHPGLAAFLAKYRFIRSPAQRGQVGPSFKCLGAGGWGAVFDCERVVPDPMDDRLLCVKVLGVDATIKRPGAPNNLETVLQREVFTLYQFEDFVAQDEAAEAAGVDASNEYYYGARFIVRLFDYFVVPIDERRGAEKYNVLIVLERCPMARPFELPADPDTVLPSIVEAKELVYRDNYSSGADVLDYLTEISRDMRVVHFVMRQLLTALRFLHDPVGKASGSGHIHRDIKVENLLLWGWFTDEDGVRYPVIKVIDFGMTREFSLEGTWETGRMEIQNRLENKVNLLAEKTANVGTDTSQAPELIAYGRTSSRYDEKVDIFAAGSAYYMMVAVQVPDVVYFRDVGFPKRFSAGLVPIFSSTLDGCAEAVTRQGQFLADMTATDPSMRKSAAYLLKRYSDLLGE